MTSGRLLGEIDLASTPAAVRLARTYVRELIGQHFAVRRSGLVDLELLTSEAVTHAVVNSRPRRDGTIMLSALHEPLHDALHNPLHDPLREPLHHLRHHSPQDPAHNDRFVRIEIVDGGPREPRTPDAAALAGRALQVVGALAADHGTHRNADGTSTFWFEASIEDGWGAP